MTEKKQNDYRNGFYQAIHVVLEDVHPENPRVTYLTSIGIVEGELSKIEKIEGKKQYKVRDIALGVLNQKENEDGIMEYRDSFIHLENVKIIRLENPDSTINFPELTLDINQIIGVSAGTKL